MRWSVLAVDQLPETFDELVLTTTGRGYLAVARDVFSEDGSPVWTSDDGRTWTQIGLIEDNEGIGGVVWAADHYLAWTDEVLGFGHHGVWLSPDGTTWTLTRRSEQPDGSRWREGSVNGDTVVIVGTGPHEGPAIWANTSPE